MKNLPYRSIHIILLCFYTIPLSGCGVSALTDIMTMQKEQMALAREQQKLRAEEQRLVIEERIQVLKRRNNQAEEQIQRQKEYDEWYRNLPPDQQYKLRLEKEKQNTALIQRSAAQEEQGASTMKVGAKFLINAMDQ